MENFKEFLKKLDWIDIAIFAAILIALIVGLFTFKHFRQTASKQIESTSPIVFQVFVRGATLTCDQNPIKAGDESFITIRNVPYTSLKVLDSKIDTKKVVIPDNRNDGKDFLIAPDYSQVYMFDIVTTFEDVAKITKDGPVVGGNKIKIGLPITLEGKTYKLNGTVSNVIIKYEIPQGEPQPAPAGQPQQ